MKYKVNTTLNVLGLKTIFDLLDEVNVPVEQKEKIIEILKGKGHELHP